MFWVGRNNISKIIRKLNNVFVYWQSIPKWDFQNKSKKNKDLNSKPFVMKCFVKKIDFCL